MDLLEQMTGIVLGASPATPEPAEPDAIKRANDRATQAFRMMLKAEEEKAEVLRALRHVLENDTDIDWQMVAEVVRKYEGPKH